MSDENTGGAPDTAAVEAEAKGMGWSPKEKWRGDPNHWVDAETFVKRGREFMPLLKAQNGRLEEDNRRLSAQVSELAELIKASSESMEELKKTHKENVKERLQRQRDELLAAKKQAKKDDDTDTEVEIDEQLADVKDALKAHDAQKEEKPKTEEKQKQPDLDPAFIAWQEREENSWFGKDVRRTRLAIAIAQELRQSGDRSVGEPFYNKVAAEVEETLGTPAPTRDKVGGGKGGSSTGGGGKAKGYAALPQDAKDACDRQGKTLVGPGRAYKTEAEWRAAYADIYFSEE